MKNRISSIIKLIYIIAVTSFIFLFFLKNHSDILMTVSSIRSLFIVASFVCILLAKIFLALFMYFVLHSIGRRLSFRKCLYIYSNSQLGKYIPGNIWHFVGKAALYKNEKMSTKEIKEAIVIENIWLLASSFLYGIGFFLVFGRKALLNYMGSNSITCIIILFLIPATYFILRYLLKINLKMILGSGKLTVKILLVLLLVWTLLGFGFGVLAMSELSQPKTLCLMVAFYALAYSIGFITPFAPAGIGIREGILTVGLIAYMPAEAILIISFANRLIYLAVEIMLALASRFILTERN